MGLSTEELQNLRQNYKKGALGEHHCAPTPLEQFEAWFSEALKSECDEPNAFTLSTIHDGKPTSRVLLFKGIHKDGPVFYTNYQSPKAQDLAQIPYACANFLWLPLQRQVRIEGVVEKVSEDMSDSYFATRPRGSQVGAHASPQGKVIHKREDIEKLFSDAEAKFAGEKNIPRPAHWGGFALVPTCWEFWQGRENRLHDRIRYRKENGVWIRERLAP